jgi:hypothetical protein
MANLPGYKEQIHEEKFDTLIRGVGTSALANKVKLFSPANVGNPSLTNMQEGGRLSNEELFLALSIRFYVQFAEAALYAFVEDGIFWTMNVGNKPMFSTLPIFTAPAGGGMSGMNMNANTAVIGNGLPSYSAILKFAKPIKIEKNQHFSVDVEFYTFPTFDAPVTAPIDPRVQINASTGLKIVKCLLGGVLERNVQ